MTTSGLRFSTAAVLLLLATASPEDALDASLMHTKCQTLLTGMSARGHSKFELSALCRARLPLDVCGNALSLLGRTPWAPTTISATCGKWQAEFAARTRGFAHERRAQTQGLVAESLDGLTQMKAEVGICVNKTLDECAQFKAQEYPKATQKILNVLDALYQQSLGNGSPVPQAPQRKYQVPELGADAGHGAGFFAGLALLSAVSAAAGAMLALRLRPSAARPLALAPSGEGSGAGAALGE